MSYTLTPHYAGGYRLVTIALAAPCSRAESLIRGINHPQAPFSWDLTPARSAKWAMLYDNGWDWDGRWFRLTKGGFRWTMRDAVHICEDMKLRGSK